MIKVGVLKPFPWLPLILLWQAYTLLGWYLSAHHVFLVAGVFIAIVAVAVARKSVSGLERLASFGVQDWRVVLTILILSMSGALLLTWPVLFTLVVIPFITTFLADLELRLAGYSKLDKLLWLTFIAVAGLGLGEVIDLVFLPSLRY